MLSDKIPIVLSFTPNYLMPAAVCIRSIINSAAEGSTFHFIFLMSEAIEKSSKADLEQIIGHNHEVSYIEMADRLANVYVIEKYTIAASYRLLLPDLLPHHDKVLYLDCDMIILNDVAKLFLETPLGENYMAGVVEATLPEQESHLNSIDCKPGEYINSGFLLMNLRKLREDDMVKKFLKASENEALEFPDQDVINMLCKGKLLALDPFWNSIRTFILPQFKNTFLKYYTESDWSRVQNHGNIHYTGPKPWNAFTVKFELWWLYYTKIPVDIRKKYATNDKIYYLYKIYKVPITRLLINSMQRIYRSFK